MPLSRAIECAHDFRAMFDPSTYTRWEFAGSLRRKCPDVGDLEHVIIPVIGDVAGGRKMFDNFDLVIDGGYVVPDNYVPRKPVQALAGDANWVKYMEKFVVAQGTPTHAKIIQINWADRQAPPLYPEFFLEIVKQFKKGKILTLCQGGHGRSGTALTSLMMALSEYSPLDAITHLRAVHCPRAIESKIQHQYLNWVGNVLGREENALEADTVGNFKDRFMTLTAPCAKKYQDRLAALAAKPVIIP